MAYNPASVVSSDPNLQHISNVIYYEKKAIDNLKANLPYYMMAEKKRLPMNSGKTIQMYEYNLFGANTTPSSEGVVGTGLTLGTVRTQASISQYTDFMTFSDLILETAIDQTVENNAAELGYRAALTVNTLVSTALDTEADAQAASQIDLAESEFFGANHIRLGVMDLRGANVLPFSDGDFVLAMHPFVAYDLFNDNTSGGYLDLQKRTDSGQASLVRGVQGYKIWNHFGSKIIETTTVPTDADYPSSGDTAYHTYMVGKDGILVISLGATEIPSDRNFKVSVEKYSGATKSDPAAVIKASIAYNFKFAMDFAPDGIPRFRRFRCESSNV